MQRAKIAFTETAYLGDAHLKFEEYLWCCWRAYDSETFKAPYVTVVQSSGFGKSRMLFELARKAKNDQGSQMKVLYTCVRLYGSTGYPEATICLRDWLTAWSSTIEQIASRLEAIYNYAINNWADVQAEWFKMFKEGADSDALSNLFQQARNDQEGEKKKIVDSSVKKNQDGKMVVLVVDEARSLLKVKANPGASIVKVNDFRLLRRALALVNNRIGAEGGIFGVFIDTSLKISDSESKVRSPLASDPSSRRYRNTGVATFPPFVLTHTMDTHWREYYLKLNERNRKKLRKADDDDMTGGGQVENLTLSEEAELKAEIAAYKAIVTGSENDGWSALLRMGRPMWWSTFTERDGLPQVFLSDLVTQAANMLLMGNDFKQEASYNEKTMFGVASMLCRLGVRPYSTSTLASQVVADFMAVLAYVKFESEGYLSSYASDPVLALGAIKVWHFLKDGLSKYILPQLKKLILDEALDTGGICEMVARILLLLAMDKCVMRDRIKPKGQFVSVESFLNVMGCDEIEVYIEGMLPGNKETFTEWKSEWKDWRMGFTHFIQLQIEPTEDTLWYLLGRRAAGILPRNQLEADLMIPVFWNKDGEKERVSFMLIQVKSHIPKDDGFSQAASKKLSPWFVFESPHSKGEKPKEGPALKKPAVKPAPKKRTVNENPLSETPVSDVIRICMNLSKEETSGPESLNDSFRFISSTSLTKDSSTPEARGEDTDVYTLCFRSLGCETYPFLKEDVAQCLASIVAFPWDPMALVDGDLKRRGKGTKAETLHEALTRAMPDHELKQTARRGLACPPGHNLKYQDEKSKKKKSRSGGQKRAAKRGRGNP